MQRPPHGIAARLPRLTLAPLVLLLAAAAPGKSDPSRPTRALSLLRKGVLPPAALAAEAFLHQHPASADGLAIAGAIDARRGWGPEAAELLSDGAHGRWYREVGLSFHAEALAEAGRFGEAAALRRAALTPFGGDGAWPDQAAALVDDHRMMGDLIGAEDALAAGLAVWPRAPVLLAAAAEIDLDAGDREGAARWLWLAEVDGDTSFRVRRTRARLARANGDLDLALQILLRLAKRRPRDPDLRALQAHVLCDQGDAPLAMLLLEQRRFEAFGHPVLHAAYGRALWLSGEADAARALSAWLTARVPGHPDTAALAELVAGAAP